ncbi:MAG TPA: redoxin family protein [Pirellulales bacterium]|nr:redoxin family protein [Pirellulales bacterium]
MSIPRSLRRTSGVASLLLASWTGQAAHAAPTVADALKLTPVQKEIEFTTPAKDTIEQCTIKPEKFDNHTGWVIRDKAGQILRRFVDTNADNVVDQWCYYQDGIEVYRDIDADFNGKPDQCRWFNMAGTRWGLDTNEDGKVDRWKEISAEEASDELVRALGAKDPARFTRLLLTTDELKALGLGEARSEELKTKITSAPEQFHKLLAGQKTVGTDARWLQFGGARPGIMPAGTDGSTKDVMIYDNAVVVAESNGKHLQLQLGTLVKAGDTWRLIGLPQIEGEGEATAPPGMLGPSRPSARAEEDAEKDAGGPPQRLLAELERLDKLSDDAADPKEQGNIAAQKAVVMQEIAGMVGAPEDRAQWIRQAADFMSATVQSGIWPEGVDRLAELHGKLAKDPAGEELAAYVEFRHITAEYGAALAKGEEFGKVQANWLARLEKFVKDHPKCADTAEAMLQLAMAQEFAGQDEEAKKWYGEIRTNFPDSGTARKATGAIARLDCVGKPIGLKGTNVNGKPAPVNLAQFKDKVVLIQYWATWCEPAVVDLAQLKEVQSKYAKDGLQIIGVSLDNKPEDLAEFLKEHKLPWPQIFEPGGLDSKLANELGILTLPTMILVGKDGKVVNRNVHITELEREVGNILHPSTARKK